MKCSLALIVLVREKILVIVRRRRGVGRRFLGPFSIAELMTGVSKYSVS